MKNLKENAHMLYHGVGNSAHSSGQIEDCCLNTVGMCVIRGHKFESMIQQVDGDDAFEPRTSFLRRKYVAVLHPSPLYDSTVLYVSYRVHDGSQRLYVQLIQNQSTFKDPIFPRLSRATLPISLYFAGLFLTPFCCLCCIGLRFQQNTVIIRQSDPPVSRGKYRGISNRPTDLFSDMNESSQIGPFPLRSKNTERFLIDIFSKMTQIDLENFIF